MPALADLETAYLAAKKDKEFQAELDYYFREFIGRPTPLYFAKRLTEHLGGAKIYLKREDLCHTGAHKINNSLAQVLLAKRMGKTRVIAETGAGQHAWPRPRQRPCSAWTARSIWARTTWRASP